MDAPFIGICSSFTDLIPGHSGMRILERFAEKGIHTGGGQAFIFSAVSKTFFYLLLINILSD